MKVVRPNVIRRVCVTVAALSLVAIFAAPSRAAIISVDFNTTGGPGTVTGDFTGSFTSGTSTAWNGLTIGGGGAVPNHAAVTSGTLTTMDATSTLNSITFSLGVSPQTYNCFTNGSPAAPAALRGDYAFIRADGGGGFGPQLILNYQFNGLIPGNTYDVKFYTAGNQATATIGGSGPTNIAANSQGTFTGLTADNSGVLAGSYTQQTGVNDASFAGIQIQGNFATPEPGTLSLLLPCGMFLIARRRKQAARRIA